jgi:hypothetical protein
MRGFRRTLSIGLGLITVMVTISCVSNSEASCALGFVRNGTTYYPYEASEPPQQGPSLGRLPSVACDDGDGESEASYREAVELRGIDPAVAFLVPDEGPSTIFAPGPPDGHEVSVEVKKLLRDDRE